MDKFPNTYQDVNLTHTQEETLLEAISSAFSVNELKPILRFRLGVDLEDITDAESSSIAYYDVVLFLVRHNRVAEFTIAAIEKNPHNQKLQNFAKEIGLISEAPRKDRLGQIINQFAHEFNLPPI